MPQPLVILGAGRLGRALAFAASRAGWPIAAAASRSAASAAALCAESGGTPFAAPEQAARAANVVLLAVPDSAVAAVAAAVPWRPGQVVLHTSGALGSEALAPVRQAGGVAGSLHPLQTVARPEDAPVLLRGATFALEGDPEAVATGRELVLALGGNPLVLAPEAKPLYHAAAVFASNYVVALAAAAEELWAAAGLPREAALPALLPLMQGAVANLGALGTSGALTGPIARGDAETVARHLRALGQAAPALLPVYRALGNVALSLRAPDPLVEQLLKGEDCL